MASKNSPNRKKTAHDALSKFTTFLKKDIPLYSILILAVFFIAAGILASVIGYNSGFVNGYTSGYSSGYKDASESISSQSSTDATANDVELTREGLPNPNTVVYVTATGSKYHLDGCTYLGDSQTETTLARARAQGYTPCSKCNPPS